jgi:hypothetical protein
MMLPGIYCLSPWVLQPGHSSDVNVQDVGSITVLKANITGHVSRIEDHAYSGSEVYAPSCWKFTATDEPERRS